MTAFTYTHSPSLAPLTTQSPQTLSATSNPPIDHLMTSVMVLRQSHSHSHSQNKLPPQILLLRRHPADSYPLKWEPPGGSIDPSDITVLSAAARELHEETNLSNPHFHTWVAMARELNTEEASRMKNWGVLPEEELARDVDVKIDGEGNVVRVTTFLETKDVWGKMNFVATVDEGAEVEIDPEEHVEWGWFTEEEVRRGRAVLPLENGNGIVNGEKEEKERMLEFTSQAVWGSVLEAFRVGRELGVIV
ncbi:NUDIX domain-containing protein [Trichoderma breve]|uniref:NUDIX domain-containing protein n=1 Tax=Trichoderma breve TaxID=2034170 RepID=A0A9W9B490_9HYPO|nr:NUDIX domain-containing protein [Trichoderma breve]KAJ4855299.1 NUDIX domain-containing protein [Trichoderma breve]